MNFPLIKPFTIKAFIGKVLSKKHLIEKIITKQHSFAEKIDKKS